MKDKGNGTSIGASLGCYKCYGTLDGQLFRVTKHGRTYISDWWDDFVTTGQVAHEDRNTIGAIQLAAKFLEVWFMIPISSLVYFLVIRMATRRAGIPFGWLVAHEKFADFRDLLGKPVFNPAWVGIRDLVRGSNRSGKARFILFPILLLLLALLANLVGPAVAVLSIPQLGWTEANVTRGNVFVSHNYSSTPYEDYADCTTLQLQAGNYSCLSSPFMNLDNFMSTATFLDLPDNYTEYNDFSIQYQSTAEVQATFQSDYSGSMWIPDRDSLATLSDQFLEYSNGTYTPSDAQQIEYHVIGPMAVLNLDCSIGQKEVLQLASNRSLDCFTGKWINTTIDGFYRLPVFDRLRNYTNGPDLIDLGGVGNGSASPLLSEPDLELTYCFPSGTGWSLNMSSSSARVNGSTNTGFNFVNISIITSGQSLYLPGLNNISSCAFDSLLSNQWPNASCLGEFGSIAPSSGVLQYVPPVQNQSIFCPFTISNQFVDYSINPEAYPQPVNYSGIFPAWYNSIFPSNNTYDFFHSEWINAALGVDVNGTVPSWRLASQLLVEAVSNWFNQSNDVAVVGTSDPISNSAQDIRWRMNRLSQALIGDGLYLAGYRSDPAPSTLSNRPLGDDGQGTLDTWYYLYVYQFGLDTHSARLGAAVLIIALVVVLAQFILWLAFPTSRLEEAEMLPLIFNMYRPGHRATNTKDPFVEAVTIIEPKSRGEEPELHLLHDNSDSLPRHETQAASSSVSLDSGPQKSHSQGLTQVSAIPNSDSDLERHGKPVYEQIRHEADRLNGAQSHVRRVQTARV
ncbi:hypothetical protein MMC20_003463 [Loxospora ochrophaea]|nr:hypothetical protein [Loxospora ochrophaea]